MTELLEQLLDEPTLPETVETLTVRLAEERLRRDRFYDEVQPDQKAEFINGEFIVHSPALNRHLAVTGKLFAMLNAHVLQNGLGQVQTEKALCVFPRNDYEPDVVFFGPAKTACLTPGTMKFPVPDFICEVLSDSTEDRDRGIKFRDYAAHGVAEYWIVDSDTEVLEQFVLRDKAYELRLKSGSGEVVSSAVPGFTIAIRAMFDVDEHLQTLRRLLG
jgi:Uma2 family endonuclease